MKLLIAAVVALYCVVACSADCPIFLHKPSASEAAAAKVIGTYGLKTRVSQFTPSMPVFMTNLAYYNATSTTECISDDKATAQFIWKYKPHTSPQSITKTVLIYTIPETCQLFPSVKQYVTLDEVLGAAPKPLGACKAGVEEKLPTQSRFISEILKQAMVEKVWPEQAKVPDSVYDCGEVGVKWWKFNNLSGCKSNNANQARVRGTVTFVCMQQARIRTVGIKTNVKYNKNCLWHVDDV